MQKKEYSSGFYKVFLRKVGSFLLDVGASLHTKALVGEKLIFPKQSERKSGEHLALVAGYFSYEDGFATFGDIEAMKVTCQWLEKAGINYDVACHHLNGLVGLPLKNVNPDVYDIFVFVCGPWKEENNDIIKKFDHCMKIGVNLSLEDINSNRFDLLYPRDLPNQFNPDVVFSSIHKSVPLIGVCLVHSQYEYGEKQRHQQVSRAVEEYLEESNVAFIYLDTLCRENEFGITSANNFESIVARLDVVISSRLHGMVFSLKNEVPVVAIDAIAGGAKLTKQAKAVEWPLVLDGDAVNKKMISESVQKCLQEPLKQRAKEVKQLALKKITKMEDRFIKDVATSLKTNELK